MAYLRLGDLLVNAGALQKKQLEKALETQKTTKQRLGELLIDQGYITEEQLITALQSQLGIDFIDLTSQSIPVELAHYVPKSIAQEHSVVPVRLDKDTLYIAMTDPLDFIAQEQIKAVSRKNVYPYISQRKATAEAISKLYGNVGAFRAIEDMKTEAGPETAASNTQTTLVVDDGSGAPTVRFVNSVIERAYTERASDIHLEPQENEMVIRMRIDGLMRRVLTVPTELQPTVISRLKVMSGMNISEHKIPQDGHASVNVQGHTIDLRVNSMPTIYGEKVVIRLLDKSAQSLGKNGIGLKGDDLDKYNALLKNSSGVILIVGPTGSGKSTTMCAMLEELAVEEVNIETLEDPVEYNIPGISQCQINEKTGMTFASGLRALLRQDPDIISVGEIRDGETASIALRAAITGHLVLSTLHTNSSIAAVSRLQDIGVEPYLISGALKGVISQRLVRKLCPQCREAYDPSDEERIMLDIPDGENVQFFRPVGCPSCNHSGYKGRQAVFEIYMIDHKARQLINNGADEYELFEAAVQKGFITMKQNCRSLVESGVITSGEAMRVVASTVD